MSIHSVAMFASFVRPRLGRSPLSHLLLQLRRLNVPVTSYATSTLGLIGPSQLRCLLGIVGSRSGSGHGMAAASIGIGGLVGASIFSILGIVAQAAGNAIWLRSRSTA